MVVLLTIVWRGIIEGQVPLEFSREGFKYEGAAEQIQRGIQPVRAAVDKAIAELRRDLEALRAGVDKTAAASADGIRQIESRIERIEEELKQ